MIKKARDLRPGDKINHRRIVIISENDRGYLFAHWGMESDQYMRFDPDSDVWVDEEALSNNPDDYFHKGVAGPFTVKGRESGRYPYGLYCADMLVGEWASSAYAHRLKDRLNTLFATRQVVTKRVEDLDASDKIILPAHAFACKWWVNYDGYGHITSIFGSEEVQVLQ